MTPAIARTLGLSAIVLTVACVLLAVVFMSGTPDAVLGSTVPEARGTDATDGDIPFTVSAGATASTIGDQLESLGVIRSSRQFQVLVALTGLGSALSAGDHLFQPGMSTPTVIRRLLVPEEVPVRRVTFPEGIRIEEMAIIAEEAGFGSRDEFLQAVEEATLPPGLAQSLPAAELLPPGQRLQGYLFPDTYILPEGSTVEELVAMMIRTMNERFTPALRAAAATQGLDTHQALTLAAIVEREAVLEEERPRIAGVFYNRIRASDLIGADPTTQFAVSLDPESVREYGYWKRELTLVDLADESPYNTRRSPGIPPGPITNPGLASIEAVAFPEETDLYYFVADSVAGDGSHRFAVTEAEHIANIQQYGE